MRGAQHRLPAALARADALPALSQSRNRVLAALLAETPSTEDIVAAIESDLGLMAAVMRHANADGPRRGRVATVADAVRTLEGGKLEKVVRAVPTYGFFERAPGLQVQPERFRLHGVAVAGIADMIARQLDHQRRDELVVAAMLHDIGKLVMADAYPGYADALEGQGGSPEEQARRERREYGIDHAVIGGVLLRRWRLPQTIARAVERHHAADAGDDAAILRLADALAHFELGSRVRPAELESAARALELGGQELQSLMYRLPERGERRRRAVTKSPLSGQEREVLRGLAGAKVYKEIALDLGIAASTVRSHLHNVYSKLGAADRAQAVLIATREGWI